MGRSRRALWTKHLLSESSQNLQKVRGRSDESLQKNLQEIVYPITQEAVILGIDSSLRGTGVAVVEFSPAFSQNSSLRLHFSQTIKISAKQSFSYCLATIFQTIEGLIKSYPITHIAIEQPIFVQNVRTAQILGAARAAAILPASLAQLPIAEYPPLRIKQAVVGFGRASKEQMAKMVMDILLRPAPLPHDESDAIAVALCHAGSLRLWKG
jgi:crossover junction endodeoxyribonuclease RuvC